MLEIFNIKRIFSYSVSLLLESLDLCICQRRPPFNFIRK